jgi:hypothetical protein
MADEFVRIDVENLRQFRRELRDLEGDNRWAPRLRSAGLEAARIGADEGQRSMLGASNPRAGSRASSTIRPLAGATRATIAVGRASAPETMGHEWGSSRFRQFPRRKEGGYHTYPAIQRKMPEILRRYMSALDDITREAFPN